MSLGLSSAEIETQRRLGHVNHQPTRSSRSYPDIVRANVLTRFNAIVTALAAVVLLCGHMIDALFAVVMVANTAVGIVQESRAKRTLDRLRILIAPSVTVVRDGHDRRVPSQDVVLGDVVRLRAGDEVPVDGEVLDAVGLDVDESALTGESEPVGHSLGDTVHSGSYVVGGSAVVRATAVGESTWIHQLIVQAKEFTPATSELRRGVDRILEVVGWLIVPTAALLTWSQLRDREELSPGIVAAVAGVIGLVPQGLVLLVSAALAVAVVRLARDHVVTQDLHAVEGLARVDVLCVDKTGTLTTGATSLEALEVLVGDVAEVRSALAAMASLDAVSTPTLVAAARPTSRPAGWQVATQVPFSSVRKWSAASFRGHGTWVVGAPEVVLAAADGDPAASVRARVEELVAGGRRVLVVARGTSMLMAGSEDIPRSVVPVALIVLAEELRPDAAATMRYFAEQGVVVKILSGDHPATVAAVAARLGVEGADRFLDAGELDLAGPPGEVDAIVAGSTVFGRVLPHQKREIVAVLQRCGHTVAMTGDGVNDIPALKQADIAIGMNTATPATRAVSQLVLFDGRFDRLPAVVAEGRRVIANMERVSALFVTKTVYSFVFAVAIGIWGATFPFLPRHMSLVSETTIGLPAFALSFRAAHQAYRPGYLRRVLRFAVPAGLAVAAVVLVGYALARSPHVPASDEEARTATTIVLLSASLWVLVVLMWPIDRFDAVVLGAMTALAALAVATPPGRSFYALDWPSTPTTLAVFAYVGAAMVAVSATARVISRG